MSVVVAIKHDGVIYMGADTQVSTKVNKFVEKKDISKKILKVNGTTNTLIGVIGPGRNSSFIKSITGLISNDDKVDYEYVVRVFIPKLIKELIKCRFIDSSSPIKTIESDYILAHKDKLFLIENDLNVTEIEEFVVIGSGKEEAYNSMIGNNFVNPNEVIDKAITNSANYNLHVSRPIHLINTKDMSYQLIP